MVRDSASASAAFVKLPSSTTLAKTRIAVSLSMAVPGKAY